MDRLSPTIEEWQADIYNKFDFSLVPKTKTYTLTIKDQLKGRTSDQVEKIILHNFKTYSEEWGNTSAAYNELDYYSFFEKFIHTKKRVLEIGSGVGFSTLKVIEKGHEIVSIEDNPFCLQKTFERVLSASYQIDKVERANLKVSNASYSVDYSKMSSGFGQKNLLVEGNLLDDNELLTWIPSLKKFDVVICWLIATHPISEIRYGYKEFKQFNYKIELLSKLLKVSPDYLNPNGYVHVIERTYYPDSSFEKESLVNEFMKLVGGATGFEIIDYEFKEIEIGDVKNGVRLEATKINDGYSPEKIRHAFMSLLLKKQVVKNN